MKNNKGFFVVDSLLGSSFLAYKHYEENKTQNIFIYAPNNFEISKIFNFLCPLVGEENIILIPSDELVRVEYLSTSKDMLAQQVYGMYSLINAVHKIIIVSPSTIYRYFPSKELFLNNCINIKNGNEYNFENIKKQLANAGYFRVNKIDQSLQFAVRGDIIDVYSLNYDNPIRIEFFGDIVESIRFFDIGTQTSIDKIEEINILPASLNLLTENEKVKAKEKLLSRYEEDKDYLANIQRDVLKGQVNDDILEITDGIISQKNYKYLGFLQLRHFGLLDYIEDYMIIVSNEDEFNKSSKYLFDESHSFLLDLYTAGKSLTHLSYFNEYQEVYGKSRNNLIINNFYLHDNSVSINIRKPLLIGGKDKNTLLVLQSYLESKSKIICFVNDKMQLEKLKLCIQHLEKTYEIQKEGTFTGDFEISICEKSLAEGFELPNENLVVLTSNELFGYRKNNASFSKKFKEGIILGSYLELTPGDYIVHEYNGIGQFMSIKTLLVDGKHEDYIQIAYAKGDVIYVPLYQFNLIRKYVGKDGTAPRLNSLGGDTWSKTKKRIKDKVNDLAERLLSLYQERSKIEGYKFLSDDEIQKEFESEFQYPLTKDQQKSLDEIKEDMESIHPMDRLLCGDVGFGKTEIAFRATMKAILSGKQVCFLCPTTLLARQHFDVALERFRHYGVNILMLSRLVDAKENKHNIQLISEGKADLVIGTHKIFGKQVKFKNLGLLIIDEEQRFGVEQKEKIKEKSINIDVLTISATPIPRTLQSSLIGLKSVSTIETPPKERMPIQTYVIPYDRNIVKDLIKKELSRNGQIFFVYNYVETIYQMKVTLNLLVPDCKIGVIHGQMDKKDVDEVMSSFYNGEIDLLLASSIIENGIDVRNANLMLIYDADHFGLSQLYQIKGRVGRGDRMAFAYLMINEHKELNEQAKKRLKSIQDFTELGSGFKIAQRDLLIRGAGDILGPEQAGFIDEVGVDMYIRLLNEAIEEKKSGIKKSQKPETYKLLDVDAYIPSTYASNEDKIEMYQKVLEAKTTDRVDLLRDDFRDIYGVIPGSLDLLFVKRKVDIHLKSDNALFEDLKEFPDRVDLILSINFTNINGIGSSLFTALFQYINQIKISYVNKKVHILIYKKTNWLTLTLKIMEIILKLYNTYIKAERIDEN